MFYHRLYILFSSKHREGRTMPKISSFLMFKSLSFKTHRSRSHHSRRPCLCLCSHVTNRSLAFMFSISHERKLVLSYRDIDVGEEAWWKSSQDILMAYGDVFLLSTVNFVLDGQTWWKLFGVYLSPLPVFHKVEWLMLNSFEISLNALPVCSADAVGSLKATDSSFNLNI